jgi:molecular chaperone IbpA
LQSPASLTLNSIEAKENMLAIRGQKQTDDEGEERRLCSIGASPGGTSSVASSSPSVEVKGASLENGLLHVDLAREVPEAMKSRAIPIASSRKVLEVKPTQVAA